MILPMILLGVGALVAYSMRPGRTRLDAPVQFPENLIPPGDWGLGHVTHEKLGNNVWVVARFDHARTLQGVTVKLTVVAAETFPSLNLSFFDNVLTGRRLLIKMNFPPDTDDEPGAILNLWGLDEG